MCAYIIGRAPNVIRHIYPVNIGTMQLYYVLRLFPGSTGSTLS